MSQFTGSLGRRAHPDKPACRVQRVIYILIREVSHVDIYKYEYLYEIVHISLGVTRQFLFAMCDELIHLRVLSFTCMSTFTP